MVGPGADQDFWGGRLALAGLVAAHKEAGDPHELAHERIASGQNRAGLEHDFKKACRLAWQTMSPLPTSDHQVQAKECIDRAQGAVTGIIAARRRAVVLVGEELLAMRQLAGDRVRELVASAR
jgi:hypothetical protein